MCIPPSVTDILNYETKMARRIFVAQSFAKI
jgi:hypothetical protein